MSNGMQPIRGLALLVLLSTAALAGCTDAPPTADSTPDAGPGGNGLHGSHDAALHFLAPNWTVGDWWTWSSPQIEGAYTSVLAADEGQDWLMATDHPDIAWFNARFDIASLGAVRKSDLAGSQGSTRVEFFQFPMTAEKTWTTTWDDEPITIQVLAVASSVAQLEARRADGTLYAKYTYDDRLGYFGQIAYYDPTGVDVGYEARITGSGANFAGDLVRWDYETVVEAAGDLASVPGAGVTVYTVPATATDVYADIELHCSAGFAGAGTAPVPFVGSLVGTDDRGAGEPGAPCPLDVSFHGVAGETAGTDEQWGQDLAGGPGTTGTYALGIYIRTMTTFKVA